MIIPIIIIFITIIIMVIVTLFHMLASWVQGRKPSIQLHQLQLLFMASDNVVYQQVGFKAAKRVTEAFSRSPAANRPCHNKNCEHEERCSKYRNCRKKMLRANSQLYIIVSYADLILIGYLATLLNDHKSIICWWQINDYLD